ncbi:MAG TPA: NADH-quinone oxidoreductase subunit NuoK [Proteobacteria bacterium]|nr:NADH-quinone oxidoreductase subunit NuoK [Pseudomonadota bacterium]
MVPVENYLVLSVILFAIGTLGVMVRRNAIVVFMSIELMLNAVNLAFVAIGNHLGLLDGQVFVLFIMAVAAAEAAIGLAIIIMLFRMIRTVDVEKINLMKW